MSPRRCIVCVGVGQWYPKGVARLASSLDVVSETCFTKFWRDWPSASPTHSVLPYGFKLYAIQEARAAGMEAIIWLDSSCWAIRPLAPAWQRLEETGVLLIECPHALGAWSTDRSLQRLGLTRDQALVLPLVVGGMFGIHLGHPIGRELFERLRAAWIPEVICGPWTNDPRQPQVCSGDPRVRGHRHDQVALGAIAYQMGLPLVPQPEIFAYDSPNPAPATVVVAHGM